jgi:hypothetical protein
MVMNKKLITLITLVALVVPSYTVAKAETATPTVAILDTAIDTSLPAFQGKIIQEVCILQKGACPNGSFFQEGPGAASMPANLITLNGFDHGTQMTSTFLMQNSNANVVFIRIIPSTATGARIATAVDPTVSAALQWVNQNAAKYNIQAVTMSQGHHVLGAAGTDYCPKYQSNTYNVINALDASGIPVFFPSGNGRDYQRLDWPGCLTNSVSVGHTDSIGEISVASNYDPTLDFFARGQWSVAGPGNIVKNIIGSSSATQVAAAIYLEIKSKLGYTHKEVLNLMSSTAIQTKGRQGTFNNLISLDKALSTTVLTPTPVITPTGPTAEEIAAQKAAQEAAAKAALQAEANAAIAAAQAEYDATVKAAADKLASTKAVWMAKLNG